MAAMCPITSWIGGPAHLRDDAAQPAMSRIGVDARMPVMHDFAIVHEFENDRRNDTASRAIMSAMHAAELTVK